MHKFPKKERLSGKKAIGQLFKKGNNSFIYPFKVLINYTDNSIESNLRLLITVPKRNFKKSVDRNRIKRLVREAWRLNKSEVQQKICDNAITVDVALVYASKTILTYKEIAPKIILILQRLIKEYEVRNATSG